MDSMEAALLQPTFLVGAERSGTTLLRLMLDHHPRIAFNPEFEYAVSQIDEHGAYPDLASYYHFLATDFIFPGANFTVNRELSYAALVHDFLRQKLTRDHKQVIGATVHHHFDRLLALWPQARFIHLIRDPRDVAKSVIGMGWAGNMWVASSRWIEAEKTWAKLERMLPKDRFVNLRYEDLIADPRAQLGQLCAFMGVDFDEAIFDYAKTSTYELPDPKLVYQWRQRSSVYDVGLVEARVGELLEERGYARSGYPVPLVGIDEGALLEQESQRWCREFRMKRYGLPLLLAAKISRHLPFVGLRDYLKLRMNQVDLKHIK